MAAPSTWAALTLNIEQTAGLSLAAICDLDASRTAAASQDFPDATTFNSIDQLLQAPDVELCVIVLPHNLHAKIALQCLNAGKHVISEKPMCISTQEATQMIEAARAGDKMLSVFHNRRQDADYQTLRKLVVEDGLIGEVFSVEIWAGGFHPQNPNWWRSSKQISGGYFYDWGAHFLDWLLGIVPGKITDVSGYFQKRLWNDVTNEDQTQALIRFESGCVANITMSSIAHADKPRWWILAQKAPSWIGAATLRCTAISKPKHIKRLCACPIGAIRSGKPIMPTSPGTGRAARN